jgi:hypothetical protein
MGNQNEYLGVKITKLEDGKMKLAQLHLISQILEDLSFQDYINCVTTPASSSTILEHNLHKEPKHGNFNYPRSTIGKLNFLNKSTCPNIAFAMVQHQCVCFSSNPQISHAKAVRCIVRYQKGTANKGIILDPNDHSFESYVNADCH